MSKRYKLIIQSNTKEATRECRVYDSYNLARDYIKSQAELHEVIWDNSDILFTKYNTIWIAHEGMPSPRRTTDKSAEICTIV